MVENPIKDSPTDVEMAWLRWSGQVAKLFFFVVATSVAISSVVWKPERFMFSIDKEAFDTVLIVITNFAGVAVGTGLFCTVVWRGRMMNDSQIQSEISGERDADERLYEERTTSLYIKDILDKNSQQFWNDVKAKFISKDRQDAIDMIEETLKHIKQFDEDAWNGWKEILDTNSQRFWNDVKNKFLSTEFQSSVRIIENIMERARNYDDPAPYKLPVLVLGHLLKMAHVENFVKRWRDLLPAKSSNHISRKSFDEKRRFGQFALDVYDASVGVQELEAIARQMQIKDKSDIIQTWFDASITTHPRFMLFVDHESRNVVLVIRGTFAINDLVIDALCDEVPFLDGYSHRGMVNGAQEIMDLASSSIKQGFEKYSDYGLLICGHSLGGGTAVIVTLAFLYDSSVSSLLPEGTRIQCVALAPPPVYRWEDGHNRLIQNIDIFINNDDIIPRISLASIVKMFKMLRAIDSLDLSNYEVFQLIFQTTYTEDTSINMEKVRNAIDNIQLEDIHLLHHPGRIHYFHRKKIDESLEYFISEQQSFSFSNDILILDQMVFDHTQPYYEEAFAKCQLDDDEDDDSDDCKIAQGI